tara:strand:- start:142 stop:411 length:270 start_codon:yes stop_codon:yes gene_type:complete
MRKNKKVVSLNPEYGIEVTTLTQIADKVKNDNPELCTILTILTASILAGDEKKLAEYSSKYLEDKVYTDKIKDSINKMLESDHNQDFDY